MADGNSEPMSQRGPPVPDTSPRVEKVENEDEGKLFTYPDWQELEMFDSDDLAPDMAIVLLPNRKPVKCVHVWMGSEFEEADVQEVANDFLSWRRLPASTEVQIEE